MPKDEDNTHQLNDSVVESTAEQEVEEAIDEDLKAKMNTVLTDSTTFLR